MGGLTQDDVARALKISRSTVNRAESGEEIHGENGRRICEFLNVDLVKAVVPRVSEGDGNAA